MRGRTIGVAKKASHSECTVNVSCAGRRTAVKIPNRFPRVGHCGFHIGSSRMIVGGNGLSFLGINRAVGCGCSRARNSFKANNVC